MPRSDKSPEVEEIRELIRAKGLRSTWPRVAVLRELRRASAPLSHAEMAEKLAADGVDRATVYRNLVDLADVGLLARSDLGDHVWRFELKAEGSSHGSEHPHFVCTECGDVSCLPDAVIRVTAGSGSPHSVTARAVEVQLKGLCDGCE